MGETLLTGGQDGALRVWDVFTGVLRRTIKAHTGELLAIAISPDGSLFASAAVGGPIRLWNATNGEFLREFGRVDYWTSRNLSFSPDGLHLLAPGSTGLTLWGVLIGKPAFPTIEHNGINNAVAVSPDGHYALTAADRSLVLWDLDKRALLKQWVGHSEYITSVSFCGDSQHGLSGGADGSVKLWVLQTGKEMQVLHTGPDFISGVGSTADGRRLICIGNEHRVKIWNLGREASRHDLKRKAQAAASILQSGRADAAAANTLGEWYAFCGAPDAAATLLKEAKRLGYSVSAPVLALSFLQSGQPEEAREEFNFAADISRSESERSRMRAWATSVEHYPFRADDGDANLNR